MKKENRAFAIGSVVAIVAFIVIFIGISFIVKASKNNFDGFDFGKGFIMTSFGGIVLFITSAYIISLCGKKVNRSFGKAINTVLKGKVKKTEYKCPYCGTVRSIDVGKCPGCGASKKDYNKE